MDIRLKRAYEKPDPSDGYRVLVDRVWPRGVRKDEIQVQVWLKEIAPSTELRKWFGHDSKKWDEFKRRYFSELENQKDVVEIFQTSLKGDRVTFVYGAGDVKHNNAVVLKEFLEKSKIV